MDGDENTLLSSKIQHEAVGEELGMCELVKESTGEWLFVGLSS